MILLAFYGFRGLKTALGGNRSKINAFLIFPNRYPAHPRGDPRPITTITLAQIYLISQPIFG
jgi:hypothetical protein